MSVNPILVTLFPIFAIILVGYLYSYRWSTDVTIPNRLNLEVFTPALIFGALSNQSFYMADYYALIFIGTAIILGSGLILILPARLLGINPLTFLPPMMFTNAGNIGIPVILLVFGEEALQAAVLLAVISVILHFTVGLYLIDRHAHLLDTLKTPIIVATVVSLIINSLNLKIPDPLMISIKMLGQISIPLMLFTLGIRFAQINFAEWRIGLLGAVLCPLSGLLIFFMIYPWFTSLSSLHLGILLVFATLPPAIANYIIAEQFQQEPKKVASIVLLGNAVSLFSLPVILTIILPYFSQP